MSQYNELGNSGAVLRINQHFYCLVSSGAKTREPLKDSRTLETFLLGSDWVHIQICRCSDVTQHKWERV